MESAIEFAFSARHTIAHMKVLFSARVDSKIEKIAHNFMLLLGFYINGCNIFDADFCTVVKSAKC